MHNINERFVSLQNVPYYIKQPNVEGFPPLGKAPSIERKSMREEKRGIARQGEKRYSVRKNGVHQSFYGVAVAKIAGFSYTILFFRTVPSPAPLPLSFFSPPSLCWFVCLFVCFFYGQSLFHCNNRSEPR